MPRMLENPWSAVGNPTCALGPLGSSFGPSSLAPLGIHQLLLSNLTTEHMLVKIEARILVFPGTNYYFSSTSVPPDTFSYALDPRRLIWTLVDYTICRDTIRYEVVF